MSGKGRQSASDSGRERAWASVGSNPRRLPNPRTTDFENFAIGTEFALLGFCFQFGVQLQELSVRDVLTVRRKNGTQRRKYSCLPINESAVAIEADHLVLGKVEHRFLFTERLQSSAHSFAPWADEQ